MLDQASRQTVLTLRGKGHSVRAIARALKVSRCAVRDVVERGSPEVPRIERLEKAEPHRQRILELYQNCKGNLVRVHEVLCEEGAELSYQGLTAYCRRHGLCHEPKVPAGHYHFEPGQEMQHDTSPHDIELGGKVRRVQTASLVLCYSRILFFQVYPQFRRFECKVFLTEACAYMGGVCLRCEIDNTHVVVLRGTGANMVPVPEMEAFGTRLGFAFAAHELGDANRSGRVERPFDYIDNNFLAGRHFLDWADANQQARQWCDKVNAKYRKHIRANPRDLYAVEYPQMKRLPIWLPEPYLLHQRIVDVDGYVTVNSNRYSTPPGLIGRRVEVRETKDRITICDGSREVASHEREVDPSGRYVTNPQHLPERGHSRRARGPAREESELLRLLPDISQYVAALKTRGRLGTTLALRRLLRMAREYPIEPLQQAIRTAAHYGLYDLERLERMVLRTIAKEYFQLSQHLDPIGDDDEPIDRGATADPDEPSPTPDGGDPA